MPRHFGILERPEAPGEYLPDRLPLDCSTFIAVIERIHFIDCIEAQCRDTSRQNVVTFHRGERVRFPFAPFNEFHSGVFHARCVFLWVFPVCPTFILYLSRALSKVFQYRACAFTKCMGIALDVTNLRFG